MASDAPLSNQDRTRQADGIPSISLLGVKVHRVDMDATLRAIGSYVRGDEPRMIVTADSYAVVLAQRDTDFREIINSADLVTPDSAGILAGAAFLGKPLITRVSGVDIAEGLCKMAREQPFSIFLLGAAPGVAETAAEKLKSRFPGLEIAGCRHGYFDEIESADIAEQIRESGAGVLLVAMGIPRQENWIRDNLARTGVRVAMGVGGSFDVFSGRVKRAPKWMQRHGLEWVYRLAKDPRKINKVAVLPRFLWLILREKCFGEKERKG